MATKENLDKVMKALLKNGPIEHKRPLKKSSIKSTN